MKQWFIVLILAFLVVPLSLASAQSALLMSSFLAFALPFDEIIVTTFTAGQQQTLPIWIFAQLIRLRDRPVTNVAALVVMPSPSSRSCWPTASPSPSGRKVSLLAL